jgi:hypothetical protein
MPKYLFLFCLFTVLASGTPAHSQEKENAYAETIILSGDFLKEEGMTQLIRSTDSLSYVNKQSLYYKYEKNPWLYSGMNILVPGLGSWMMGDTFGALLTEIGTAAILTTAVIAGLAGSFHRGLGALIVLAGGMTVEIGVGAIIPFIYAGNYNSKLKLGLGIIAYERTREPDFAMNTKPIPSGMFELDILSFRF